MNNPKSPKVFICHAKEDKERFVLDFAKKLREKGIDAWLDEWEMKPGDSLVDKIFEEGIKECDMFMVILSEDSINKRWVRDELNSAIVQRIEKSTKIIPVIIDENVEVPTSLKHIIWVKIQNLSDYKEEFRKILSAIYDEIEKPSIGGKPAFTNDIDIIPGLNKIDSIVLKIAGDIVYQKDDYCRIVDYIYKVMEKTSDFEISREEIFESLDILEVHGFLKIDKYIAPKENYHIRITPLGFFRYCETFLEDFDQLLKDIVSSIINEDLRLSGEITSKLGCKLIVVNSLLEYFSDCGYIEIISGMSKDIEIYEIKGEGKRYFREVLHDS